MLDARVVTLRQMLRSLGTRSGQALQYFALDGLSVVQCAERFGIRESAFEVMLLRAAEEYGVALSRVTQEGAPKAKKRRGQAWRFAEESERAQRFHQALEGSAVPAEPTLLALRDALQELRSKAAEIRQQDDEALRLALASPKHREELWMRRLFVVAALVLTALMYARDRVGDKKPITLPAVRSHPSPTSP
ncbi:MAG: hypothetical protein ACT4TC_23640 [Myxococcaceae bacterium]